MIVKSVSFHGSGGRSFVGILIEIIQIIIIQRMCLGSWGFKHVDKGYPRKQRTVVSHEQ